MANQNQQKVPDLVPINGSTNVYVGQRYVPKFYDDGTEQHGATWDKTKTYEPLTIVLWEGDSYTSRTFVPAGVEITDTQYWLQTGIFNAQLESYVNRLIEIEKKFPEPFYLFIGDSYGANLGDRIGWVSYLVNKLGIADNQYYNMCAGGGGLLVADNSYLNQLMTAPVDKGNVTHIIIAGGTNDVGKNIALYEPAWEELYSYCKSNYPGAKIYVGMCAGAINGLGTEYPRTLAGYSKAEVYMQNIQYVFHNYDYIKEDKVHPTNEGLEELANKIYAAINGGCSVGYWFRYDSNTLSFAEGVTSSPIIGVEVDNGVTNVAIASAFNISYGTPISITNNKDVELMTFNGPLLQGSNAVTCGSRWMGFVNVHSTANNSTYTINVIFTIRNRKLYITPYDISLGTTGAFSSIDVINIPRMAITLPTMDV